MRWHKDLRPEQHRPSQEKRLAVVGGDHMSPVTIWQARMKPIRTKTKVGMNMAVPLFSTPLFKPVEV
jgi:hypothetical protein